MATYIVKDGQNIYDVALTLYGTVEGVFDLLVCNKGLSFESEFHSGDIISYHDDFAINRDVMLWIREKGKTIKNGHHYLDCLDIESMMRGYVQTHHPDLYASIMQTSAHEQKVFWCSYAAPKILIVHSGENLIIPVMLKEGCFLIADWGDNSFLTVVEKDDDNVVEHCFKGGGEHVVTLYGNFVCEYLDLSGVNGSYFPLDTINADHFLTGSQSEETNKLIITQ